ncbi:MAG: metal ABC transporter substrate-binding protein, partial [Planctomycetales bacterium]
MRRILVAAALLFAWAVSPDSTRAQEPAGKKLIVCSTTQTADFARQVVGDRWEVRSILPAGADPHQYVTRPGDARLVARADLCVDNGLHLEGGDWMKVLAKTAGKPLISCTNGIKPLELLETGKDGKPATIDDPHAWFSPRNAAIYTQNILKAVTKLDPAHAAEYRARAEFYLDQLRSLHAWIERRFNDVPPAKRVLVTSHDAFNYFCREYKFKSAAPTGWSTGEEVGGGITPQRRKQVIESIRSFGV